MPRTVVTTTISLPKSMASVLKELGRSEGRTTSELIREALRHYERLHRRTQHTAVAWDKLRARLARISATGRSSNLAAYIARDRNAH